MNQGQRERDGQASNEHDRKLANFLAEFVDRQAESKVDVEALLAENPDFASDLRLLADLDSRVISETVRTAGRQFGDFTIRREVGRGGMGIVYEAWQESLSRRVALKILPASSLASPSAVARFYREARVAASLHHPNVVEVYAMGVEQETPYFAMEFAEGETLHQILARLKLREMGHSSEEGAKAEASSDPTVTGAESFPTIPGGRLSTPALGPPSGFQEPRTTPPDGSRAGELPPAGGTEPVWNLFFKSAAREPDYLQLAAAFAGAVEGLQHAHANGVIHRDLKPSNLILDVNGRLRILDFGLACAKGQGTLTMSLERMGTPSYMSPEQAQGPSSQLSQATDIYSFGATLYEVLAWRPPFRGRNTSELIDQIIHADPEPPRRLNPAVPRDLETVALKCLRKKPSERYGTAEALAQDLRRFARGDPIEARPESWHERLVRKVRRSRRKIVEACGAVCLLAALLAVALNHQANSRKAALAEYDRDVREAVMGIVKAEMLGSDPLVDAVPTTEFPVLSQGDSPAVGSRAGDSSRSYLSGSQLFLAGARVGSAGEDPLEKAVNLLTAAVKNFPEIAVGPYHLARALLLQGKKAAAEKQLRAVLRLDPSFLPAANLLAFILEQDHPQEARVLAGAVADAASAEDSRWSHAWLKAQRALLEKRWQAAYEAFEATRKSEEAGEDVYLGYAIETYLGRSIAKLKTGRPGLALYDLGAATAELPQRLEPRVLAAEAYHASGERKEAARKFEALHNEALQGGVHSPDQVALAVAGTYAKLGEYQTALQWAARISDRSAVERGLLQVELHCYLEEQEEAWKVASAMLDRYPRNSVVLLAAGHVALERKDCEAAQVFYRQALTEEPGDVRPRVAMAACLEQEGHFDGARDELLGALRLDPDYVPAHYNLARILTRLGDLEGAIQSYLEAVRIDPGDALAHNNLGVVYDRRGERERARERYARVIELRPSFAPAHYNLGWVFHRQRRYKEAAAEYEQALALGLDDPRLHSHLGACLHYLDQVERAISEYEKAIEKGLRDSIVYHDLGAALFTRESYVKAASALRESIRLEPKGGNSYLILALAFEELKNDEEAERVFREGLRQDPRDVELYNFFASFLLARGRMSSGEDLRGDIHLLERGERLPGIDRSTIWLLSQYRQAYLPRLSSCASADCLFDGPRTLLQEDSSWRFFRGVQAPAEGWEWTGVDFPDAEWAQGKGPFGYAWTSSLGTDLEGMRGGYSSLYLRSRFNMDDPLGVREPNLVIESDDGFVVFLNGKEIFRRGLGDPGSEIPFDAVTGRKFEGWRPEEIAIAPEGLRAGENVLAIQQVNSSPADEKSFLRVRLRSLSSQETAIERAAAGLRAFREVVRPEDEETVLYCEARLLEAAEDFAAAADKYRRSLDLGATGAQPCLRLAACLRREGKLTEAEQVLRQALRSPSPLQQEDALWDSWLKCHFADLGTEHREVLALHRLLGRPAEKPTQHQEDISWLLQRLAAGEEIRINCGGKDCEAGGVVWSRDRFARGGDTAYFSRVDPQDRRVQAPLDQTARCFSSSAPLRPGYRIPLPNGDYELLLRFVEGSSEEKGHRRFDVLIEGAVAIPKYEPLAAVGFGVPDDVPAQARITDGDLEIDFRSLEGSPVISAMRIRRMDPAGR